MIYLSPTQLHVSFPAFLAALLKEGIFILPLFQFCYAMMPASVWGLGFQNFLIGKFSVL
jgi:hypothetical protein